MRQKCSLILSNGQRFEGALIGAPLEASGELVFTTGMVGYSEAITDPSYFGQILTFTYPLIGNYGVPKRSLDSWDSLVPGFESARCHVAAVVLSVDSYEVFHWSNFQSLDAWLKSERIPGIVGLDTRHLVHQIRSEPNLLGRVVPEVSEGQRLAELGIDIDYSKCEFYDPGKHEIISHVSVDRPMTLGTGDFCVGVIDCGIKWNIVRQLLASGGVVKLLPWNEDLEKHQHEVDAWLISNGPGDPTKTGDLVQRVRGLLGGQKPVFGICLGHQIICLAAGASTSRMNYGHRSQNQPVYEVGTRKGYITTQNHGYIVDDASLPKDWKAWFRNVNDQTIEGIRHETKPMRSVQFHPEACGGPRDTAWILEEFVKEIRACR